MPVAGERLGQPAHPGVDVLTAAFDERLKAIVSCCGFTSFPKYYGGDLTGWTSDRYMPRVAAVYGKSAKKVPFDFPEVVSSFAPRAFLAVAPVRDDNFAVAGVRDVIAVAEPAYKKLGAADKLKAIYPEGGHDFPADARKAAYEFIDAQLKKRGERPRAQGSAAESHRISAPGGGAGW